MDGDQGEQQELPRHPALGAFAPRVAQQAHSVLLLAGDDSAQTLRSLHALVQPGSERALDVRVLAPEHEASRLAGRTPAGVRLLALSPQADPTLAAGIAPDEPLFLIEDGSLPPPGWTDVLSAHGRAHERPGERAWVAASTNKASGPERISEHRQESEQSAQLLARFSDGEPYERRSWCNVHEDIERVDSPALLVPPGPTRNSALRRAWSTRLRNPFTLPPSGCLKLARDLVVWRDETNMRLRAEVSDPLVPGELRRLDPAAVRPLVQRLELAAERGVRPLLRLYLAELLTRVGSWKRARAQAQAGLELWPRHVGLTLAIVESEVHGGSLARGRRRLDELLIELRLSHLRRARVLALRGEAWLGTGELENAEQCFESALDLDPLQSAALAGRGRMKLSAGHFESACQDLETVVQVDPLRATGWLALSRARAMSGELTRARTALSRALVLRPEDREAARLAARLDQQLALEAQVLSPQDPAELERVARRRKQRGSTTLA